MKMINDGAFRRNCFSIMEEVKAKRETVVITKRSKPVAKLVPVSNQIDDILVSSPARAL